MTCYDVFRWFHPAFDRLKVTICTASGPTSSQWSCAQLWPQPYFQHLVASLGDESADHLSSWILPPALESVFPSSLQWCAVHQPSGWMWHPSSFAASRQTATSWPFTDSVPEQFLSGMRLCVSADPASELNKGSGDHVQCSQGNDWLNSMTRGKQTCCRGKKESPMRCEHFTEPTMLCFRCQHDVKFAALAGKLLVELQNQSIASSAAGAHHHNGAAEHDTKTVMSHQLLHCLHQTSVETIEITTVWTVPGFVELLVCVFSSMPNVLHRLNKQVLWLLASAPWLAISGSTIATSFDNGQQIYLRNTSENGFWNGSHICVLAAVFHRDNGSTLCCSTTYCLKLANSTDHK